ncbi:hypothetical protein OsI_28015 [Oryza sativa Indica Group]|uniref:Uncharacterized protein n=1 Tax=Oryza sativa subsp. indica TaxID=39946 RepID=B8BB75_ORYSI|nr:hypothetical protein OsI_28015 [Oryza sativa Indica Group]
MGYPRVEIKTRLLPATFSGLGVGVPMGNKIDPSLCPSDRVFARIPRPMGKFAKPRSAHGKPSRSGGWRRCRCRQKQRGREGGTTVAAVFGPYPAVVTPCQRDKRERGRGRGATDG